MSRKSTKILKDTVEGLEHYLGPRAAREIRDILQENAALKAAGTARADSVDLKEYGRYGDDWQQNTMYKYLGDFNPDQIPMATYDKMRWDGQLRLGLMTIKLPIMSRDFWVECEDKDIQAFVYQNLKEIWRPLIKSMLTALDYGFAPHEKIWENVEGYRVVNEQEDIDITMDVTKYKTIKDLCPKTITVDYTDKMRFNGMYQNKNRANNVFIPPEKCFVFTNDKEWGNVYGWSRLKPAYPCWYTYWILDAWHERWLQKRGIPPVIVHYPIGKSQVATTGNTPVYKDNQEIARDAAKSLQPDSVVTIPSDEIKTPAGKVGGWDIKVFEDNTRIDAFVEAKEALDIRKLRAILVPERAITQDSSTGSFKMAESHIWIMMESLKGLIGDIADHINTFLIPQLVNINFGERSPRASIHIEEIGKELSGALFEIYLGLVQSGKAHPGVKKIEELLNIPAETDKEREEREAAEAAQPQPAKQPMAFHECGASRMDQLADRVRGGLRL